MAVQAGNGLPPPPRPDRVCGLLRIQKKGLRASSVPIGSCVGHALEVGILVSQGLAGYDMRQILKTDKGIAVLLPLGENIGEGLGIANWEICLPAFPVVEKGGISHGGGDRRLLAAGARRASAAQRVAHAKVQLFRHRLVGGAVLKTQNVAHFVNEHRQEVHVPGSTCPCRRVQLMGGEHLRKLGIVGRRRIDEPTVAGGVAVDPNGVLAGQTQ